MTRPLITILLMSLGTFATRSLGFYLMEKVPLSDRAKRGLAFLPPTILTSIISAQISHYPPKEYPAVLLCVIVGFFTRSVLLTVICGVFAAFAIRNFT